MKPNTQNPMASKTSHHPLDPENIPPHIRKAWNLARQADRLAESLWVAFEKEFFEIYQNEELEKMIEDQEMDQADF